jgi:hypothetical protein
MQLGHHNLGAIARATSDAAWTSPEAVAGIVAAARKGVDVT